MYCPRCGANMRGATCTSCGSTETPRIGPNPNGGASGDLAGWLHRVGATVIDALILFAVYFVLLLFLPFLAAFVVYQVLSIGYFIYFLSQPRGQTFGNIAVGTQVRSATTGGPLPVAQAATRWAAQLLPSLVAGLIAPALITITLLYVILDSLFPLWDAQKQTIHDKAAGTLVVTYRRP